MRNGERDVETEEREEVAESGTARTEEGLAGSDGVRDKGSDTGELGKVEMEGRAVRVVGDVA